MQYFALGPTSYCNLTFIVLLQDLGFGHIDSKPVLSTRLINSTRQGLELAWTSSKDCLIIYIEGNLKGGSNEPQCSAGCGVWRDKCPEKMYDTIKL